MTILTAARVRITVDGSPLESQVAAELSEIIVEQRSSSPACLTMTFFTEPANNDRAGMPAYPARGSEVKCQIDQHTLFEGAVFGHTHTWDHQTGTAAAVAVRAYDQLHQFRDCRRTATHTDSDPIEIIRQLADERGFGVDDQSGRSWHRRT